MDAAVGEKKMRLTIYEQIKMVLADRVGNIVKSSEVKKVLLEMFGTKPNSVILSDYCYNRYNAGISFKQHLFVYMGRNTYKYIGERAPYTGFIFQKPKMK